jgi:hypothetical protein
MPSRRVLGALVAAVFAIGLLAGAALGPAPEGSLADSSTIVQRVIALLAARGEGGSQASAPTTSGTSTATGASATLGAGAAPTSKAKPGSQPAANRAATPSSPESSSAGESAAGSEHASSGGPNKGESGPSRPARLPPIQHVWLIMLGGSTIAGAETTPTGYPYLVGQLVKQGALLRSYSALDAYELAGDATLLPGGVGASLSVIQEPGCEGAPAGAGAGGAGSCPQGAQASPAEADQFLQGTVGPILSSPTYRENGLIVITFVSAQASAGASASTLALQPVAGALLLSPLLRGGAAGTSTFNSLSPRTSLANIFRP